MGISHVVADKTYSAQYIWGLLKDDFFGWGFKKFMTVLKNGYEGITIPWVKGDAPNCSYRIAGQDMINFKAAIEAKMAEPKA